MKPGRKKGDDLAALVEAHMQSQANPERVGCPTLETLETFLRGKLNREVMEALYDHLPHCRECLLELKTLSDIRREKTRKAKRKR